MSDFILMSGDEWRELESVGFTFFVILYLCLALSLSLSLWLMFSLSAFLPIDFSDKSASLFLSPVKHAPHPFGFFSIQHSIYFVKKKKESIPYVFSLFVFISWNLKQLVPDQCSLLSVGDKSYRFFFVLVANLISLHPDKLAVYFRSSIICHTHILFQWTAASHKIYLETLTKLGLYIKVIYLTIIMEIRPLS